MTGRSEYDALAARAEAGELRSVPDSIKGAREVSAAGRRAPRS